MARRRGAEADLLAETIRPERLGFLVVAVVLTAMLAIRLALPLMLARFVDLAIERADASSLVSLASLYVVLALVAQALLMVVTWRSVHLSWRAGNRLRKRLADHSAHLDMAWHSRHSPGLLIERIDGDVTAMVTFFTNVLVQVVGNAVLTVAMLVVAFSIDLRAGLVLTLTTVSGAYLLFRLRLAAVPAREAEREVNARLYGDLEERLGGLEDLRANGAGEYAVGRLMSHSAMSWRAARRASLLGDGAYAAAAITFGVGSAATLVVGFALERNGLVTVGQVVALYRYSELMRMPLELIAEQLKEFQKAFAGARRANQILNTRSALDDGPLGHDAVGEGAAEVRFDGVTFAYESSEDPVLRDLDLVIPAGTHLGVVGRSGSGKTTLGRLLLRLWETTRGSVSIAGIDVRRFERSALRRHVAVVTQDVDVLRASVRDNLTLLGSRPADDATLESILNRVGLDRWLAALPDGLDTKLDGPSGLSAGEAQLLAFARAFLTDPSVVLLDEASSRLDPETERHIAQATAELLAGRTAIVIAHRLDTLEHMDHIAVLSEGRLVEWGQRQALADDPTSTYSRLRQMAAGGIDVDEALT
ncbi:MAG: ABC transporter ATP-binding protein [Acidimicrobiales bacterium]